MLYSIYQLYINYHAHCTYACILQWTSGACMIILLCSCVDMHGAFSYIYSICSQLAIATQLIAKYSCSQNLQQCRYSQHINTQLTCYNNIANHYTYIYSNCYILTCIHVWGSYCMVYAGAIIIMLPVSLHASLLTWVASYMPQV